jgi:DNA modification methylase
MKKGASHHRCAHIYNMAEQPQQALQWHTEQRRVSELKGYDKNPRYLTPEQENALVESLQRFNLVEIPAINADGTIIAGHQRCAILHKLGRGEQYIDVRVPNRALTEAEFAEYNVRSNANTGSWDEEMSAQLYDAPMLEGWGLDVSDMKLFQTSVLLQDDEANDIPLARPVPVVRTGDLFELGKHRILCGDAKSSADFALLMQGKKADMIFTDPPYNVRIDNIMNMGATKHREFTEASGEMTEEEFTQFLTTAFRHMVEYSKTAALHFVCMDWKHGYEIISAARAVFKPTCKDWYKQRVTWAKDVAGMGTFYRSQTEDIYVFKSGKGKHTNNFELGQHGRYRSNLWEYAGQNSFSSRVANADGKITDVGDLKYHPTVKPLAMVVDAILDCSHRDELILDPFLGSGTSVVAATKTGRTCYGMEIDPAYIEVCINRYCQYMAQGGQVPQFRHINGDLTLEQLQHG